MEKISKKFCKDLPTMVGQRRKFCLLEPPKRLFHHSLNTSSSKDSSRVSTSVQSQPHLALKSATKSKPLCTSCLWSWPTGLTLRTCTCNNVQLRRFTPTNAQKIKHANYLHLQTEQLLEKCQQCLRKN